MFELPRTSSTAPLRTGMHESDSNRVTPRGSDPASVCQKDSPPHNSTFTAASPAYFLKWTGVFIMAVVSFNHTMWLAALQTSSSPVYGGVQAPQTGPIAYILARYIVGANLSYSFGLFYLRSGYNDFANLTSTGLKSFLIIKTRLLLVTIVLWEVLLYPLLLCIGSRSRSSTPTGPITIIATYFRQYTGIGQLQMSYIVLWLVFSLLLALLHRFLTAVRGYYKPGPGQSTGDQLLPVTQQTSAAPLHVSWSFSDLLIRISGTPSGTCKSADPVTPDTSTNSRWSGAASQSSCNRVDDSEQLDMHDILPKQPCREPFNTCYVILAVFALVLVQTAVMYGPAHSKALDWNVHVMIFQFCTLGQYIIMYFLGAYLQQYRALERLPVCFGHWCLGLSIVLYTAAYVGTLFRHEGGHMSSICHLYANRQTLFEQLTLSPWSDRVPTASTMLSPRVAPIGMLLSTSSASWLLFDCFVTQTWAVMITVGLLVFFQQRFDFKPSRLGELMIDAVYSFYLTFPLVLVSLARAFEGIQWYPLCYVAVVWPLCFVISYSLAITLKNVPGVRMFL